MLLSLEEISLILKNHRNDEDRLKSLYVLTKFIQINSLQDLNIIMKSFLISTDVFNFLVSKNILNGINSKVEYEDFLKFLDSVGMLNCQTDMGTAKNILSIYPEIIIEVLNSIRGGNKNDQNKIELITISSETIKNLIDKIGQNDVARLLSSHFVDYNYYVKCCEIFNIDSNIYSAYKEKIATDNDTITIFGEHQLRFSQMTLKRWYSFEKDFDGVIHIFNIKKDTDTQIKCDQSTLKNGRLTSSERELLYTFSGKGHTFNRNCLMTAK